jgi:long-chain acyl-CoA synthetase
MANVIDPISQHAAAVPDSVAVRTPSDAWTYAQLRDAALTCGGSLTAAGIAPGDRVLLAAPTTAEFIVAYMGIQAIGAIVVPVNTLSTAHEIAYYLRDAGCCLAIGWHELGPAVADAAAEQSVPFRSLPQMNPGTQDVADATPVSVVDRDPDDTCTILYTSGTTGRPKGAKLTTRNLLSAGQIAAEGARGTREDRTGTALPLFHVFGQSSVMMSALTGGGSLSLLPRFDPVAMIDMLRRDKLTIMCGVPTMWNAMLHAASDATPKDFEQLRIAVSGGASLPPQVARAFEAKFGCTLLEGYGLTETTALGTFNSIDTGAKIGSTGSPMSGMEVEVRDPGGNTCPPNTVGEVFVAGPTVSPGYWNRPEATADAVVDGWFRTGDLGEIDGDGDLRIVDRLKDLIIHGGYNVYPGEVEEVLYEHPDIVEVAIVGVPDEHYGEQVAALIVTSAGSALDADGVQAWTRERLSAYKIPRIVRFTDTVPKGATGKILKRAIDRDELVRTSQPSDGHSA